MSQDLLHAIFQENGIGNRDAELEDLRHRCETLEAAVLSLALGIYDLQDYVALYSKYPRLRGKLKKCTQNMHVPLAKYHAIQFKKGGPPIQIDTQYLVRSAMSLERLHVLDLFKQGYHTVAGSIYINYEAMIRRSRYYKFLEQTTKVLLMSLGVIISLVSLIIHVVRKPKSVIGFIVRADISLLEKINYVVQTWFPMFTNPERYLRDVQNDTNHKLLADISGTLEANFWSSELGSGSDGDQFEDTVSDTASDESDVIKAASDKIHLSVQGPKLKEATVIGNTPCHSNLPDASPMRGDDIDKSVGKSNLPIDRTRYNTLILIFMGILLMIIYLIL